MSKILTITLAKDADGPVALVKHSAAGEILENVTVQAGGTAVIAVDLNTSIGVADLGARLAQAIQDVAAASAPSEAGDPNVNPTTPALAAAAGEGVTPANPDDGVAGALDDLAAQQGAPTTSEPQLNPTTDETATTTAPVDEVVLDQITGVDPNTLEGGASDEVTQ